ncbi:hypothetical protein BDZ91DRAFT_377746 [Kalaharituber pfeilii]|nr:hypothetical protein BDZ91DRAFT_377746 [Kalaharituber pfeilii]
MYSSDEDEPDYELLALLKQHAVSAPVKRITDTRVLRSAEYIVDNAIDVFLQPEHVIKAADRIWGAMKERHYSTETWSQHELHPKAKDEDTLHFIFTMDLLNFSFWSELSEEDRFCINYKGKKWTGYWSLIALLQRALDEGIPITCPYFWVDKELCTEELLQHVFRSDGKEPIPLLQERIHCLREAGAILCERYDGRFANCVKEAGQSAAALVILVVDNFPCFDDSAVWNGKEVRFYKRAQILVADVWACFNATSYGTFTDISSITMFADYRVPVMLHTLLCLIYSPTLTSHIHNLREIPSGHTWEIQIRGCSIWCVEMIRRTIERRYPEARGKVNSILIDFYLYDVAKELEGQIKKYEKEQEEKARLTNGMVKEPVRLALRALNANAAKGKGRNWEEIEGREQGATIPHHRTRSIWY